jgi:fused signal recognition particle receptor
MGLFDFFKGKTSDQIIDREKLEKSLEKSRETLVSRFTRTVVGKTKVDDEVLDELEEILIESDVGVPTTLKIIKRIEERVRQDKYLNTNQLYRILKEEIISLLDEPRNQDLCDPLTPKPYVILVVGVNGVGKTTTLAGKKVILGAADTFRAAAVEQIKIWGERVGARVIFQKMGSDPASVAYDTLHSAIAGGEDICIIDTAGRLHNKIGLMNELSKIKSTLAKLIPDAPHEVLLVIDASTGQNAFEQTKQFNAATQVSSLAVTKLDGTAKGGVVIGISDQFNIPVKYIGVGEGLGDLQLFDRKEFVNSFFHIPD